MGAGRRTASAPNANFTWTDRIAASAAWRGRGAAAWRIAGKETVYAYNRQSVFLETVAGVFLKIKVADLAFKHERSRSLARPRQMAISAGEELITLICRRDWRYVLIGRDPRQCHFLHVDRVWVTKRKKKKKNGGILLV